jgi:hypothetical protein
MSLAELKPCAVERKLLEAINVKICKTVLYEAKNASRRKPKRVGRARAMPTDLEHMMSKNIRARRRLKYPVYKFDVIEWANKLIQDTPVQKNFKGGIVSDNWYYSFLTEYDLSTEDLRPLDITRKKWETSGKIKEHYDLLQDTFLKLNLAVVNPDYKKGVQNYSEPIFITHPDRVCEFDETGFSLDMTSIMRKRVLARIADVYVLDVCTSIFQ